MDKLARKAVLVLGMHRSGTSAITRVPNLLGVDLPTRLWPPGYDNRLGFWEGSELVQLHEEALASCNSSWDDWRSIPSEWFRCPVCLKFGERIAEIIKADFANSPIFVIKDPRMCRLVPLWIQTLVHLEIEPLALISVRHPAEVAASLQTRNAFDPALSNLLWLRHVLDAERYTRGITRSVFKFNDLLCDWRRTVRRIGEDLQIGWPIAPQSAAMEIDGFLSPDDRHYWADRNHDNLPDLVSAVYEALVNETEVNRKRWDQRNWDHLRAELDRATAIYGDLLSNKEYEVAALKASLDEAEREIEHLNADRSALLSSRSWRITAPLRTIAGSRAKKRDVLP